MYTFGFIVGDIIPKSVKFIHSATIVALIVQKTSVFRPGLSGSASRSRLSGSTFGLSFRFRVLGLTFGFRVLGFRM